MIVGNRVRTNVVVLSRTDSNNKRLRLAEVGEIGTVEYVPQDDETFFYVKMDNGHVILVTEDCLEVTP